uniref:Dolichyl-diphosphooligosaccharide--protein glycosyltransferase subunit 1 n=1 Tax=Spumella elongata TaxID=89044 RepID=A0A7S3LZI6_9STRA
MSVTSKGNELTVKAPVMNGDYTIFAVEVKESSPSIKVSSVFTSILEPYPAEITQREPQFIRLKDSHYFLSPYATETQKTTVKLASPTVESFTKLAPFTNRGNSLQFGPYENIAPYSASEASVHYLNNFPFAKFSTMTRELEVSHWGSIAVEEIYELQHAGAKLAGGFSRIDYQMMRGGPGASPSFRSVVATLPAQASGIYYRDQIGNISTSTVRHLPDGELELELESRFPIFGGWKTQFYLGYSVPTENWITTDGADRYNLKLDFFTAFDNVWVEDMELKVVLPEGCENIKVNVPYAVEQSSARRFTYLDSELNGGRPVIILRAKNLVSEHDKQVTISYTFAKKRIYVEPLMLVATFFVFFVLCSLLSRTGSAATSTKAKKAATSAAQEETN